MKQPNKPQISIVFLTPKEAEKRWTDWAADPMSLVIAAAMLLAPEFQDIVQHIRRKYELELLPVELQDRVRFIKQKLKPKDQKKIWKEAYRSVGEIDEFKNIAELAVKLNELAPLLEKFMQVEPRKGRPPISQWQSWPQADISNLVAIWATNRVLTPLPEYFYNSKAKMSADGVPITLTLLSGMNQDIVTRHSQVSLISRPRSKKRNRETLDRDAYFYLLKHDGAGMTATDVASYLIEEGSLEEYPAFESEEQEYQYRKKLSWKVAKACNRFEEYVSSLVGQNS